MNHSIFYNVETKASSLKFLTEAKSVGKTYEPVGTETHNKPHDLGLLLHFHFYQLNTELMVSNGPVAQLVEQLRRSKGLRSAMSYTLFPRNTTPYRTKAIFPFKLMLFFCK